MATAKYELGLHLCEALGLLGKDVHKVTLEFEADNVGTIAVATVKFMTKDEAGKIIELLKKYDLVEKEV